MKFEKLSGEIFLQSNKADGMIWPVVYLFSMLIMNSQENKVDKDDNRENEKPVWNEDRI